MARQLFMTVKSDWKELKKLLVELENFKSNQTQLVSF